MWPAPAPASAFSPRLVSVATSAATTATMPATMNAVLMPDTNVSCATFVIFSTTGAGSPDPTGGMPTSMAEDA